MNNILLKECYDTSSFLRPDQYASLLLIIWTKSNYQVQHVPKLFYRLGFYEVDDDERVFYVGSSDVNQAPILYYFPCILDDYPVVLINLDVSSKMRRLAFIELYNLDKKAVHYIIPRVDKYENPYRPDEAKFTEIKWTKQCVETKSQADTCTEELPNLATSESFHAFLSDIFRKQKETEKCGYAVENEVHSSKIYHGLVDKPMFLRKEGDSYGFLWLSEKHWKIAYQHTGYSSTKTAIPLYLMPFIDSTIGSIGDEIIYNMLTSLSLSKIPSNIYNIIKKDTTNLCRPEISISTELCKTFCCLDLANALFSRRKPVVVKDEKIDFADHFAILTYERFLDDKRTALDPCDPFSDDLIASLYSLKRTSEYIRTMQSINCDKNSKFELNTNHLNMVKLRIIAGEIVSLQRNGVTYGVSNQQKPPTSIKKMNEILTNIKQIFKSQSHGMTNSDLLMESLRLEKDNIKREILTGLNEVETVVYLVNNEAIILNPLLPEGTCLYGAWCMPNTGSISIIEKLILFTEIVSTFYNYNHFVPFTSSILHQCLSLNMPKLLH